MSYFEYIPDKKMYAAVIGACKYIRDTGFLIRQLDIIQISMVLMKMS